MIKKWWKSLSQRETVMVTCAIIAGFLFIAYQFILTPIGAWRTQAYVERAQQKVIYEQVILAAKTKGNSSKNSVGEGKNNGNETNTQSPIIDKATPLKSALDQSARQFGLIIASTDGNDNQGVQISLAACEPVRFYDWLAHMQNQYGATLTQARLGRARTNRSLLKAERLVFSRSLTPTPTGQNQ